MLLVFVGMCSVVLVKFQYLPNDWLERLLQGSLTVSRESSPNKPRLKSVYDVLCLFCCFTV